MLHLQVVGRVRIRALEDYTALLGLGAIELFVGRLQLQLAITVPIGIHSRNQSWRSGEVLCIIS